jgi:catechol 2,3-dioxygenase-like lactoylglutathione lyase family enzyme
MAPLKLRPMSVAIVVSDRKKAVKWYTQKLGMDLLTHQQHWAVVGSKKGGIQLHLCAVKEYDPKGKLEKGNTGIMLRVPGKMMLAYEALRKKGVKFPFPPEKMEWGWFCGLSDPDGNVLWLTPTRD